MADYQQLRMSELRELCDDRCIDRRGLKKAQLVQALRAWDDENEAADGGDDRDDDEVVINGGDGGAAVAQPVPGQLDNNESIEVLKLKLELAQQQAIAREREVELREREWVIERERAATQAQNNPSAPPTNRANSRAEIHHLLPKMGHDEDVLGFFQAFERSLQLNSVPRGDWPLFLPAQLNAKANKVLTGLSLEQNKDYDQCKRAVLAYYQLGAASYLKMFRTMRKSDAENYKMYKNRLHDVLKHYVESKEIVDLDSLADCMLSEQFLNMIPVETKQFVMSRQPNDSEECCHLADLYDEMTRNATKGGQPVKTVTQNEAGQTPQQKPNGGNKGYGNGQKNPAGKKPVACWNCNALDHKYNACPHRVVMSHGNNAMICKRCGYFHMPNTPCYALPVASNSVYATAVGNRLAANEEYVYNPYVIPVCINGNNGYALRDTGNNSLTLVDPAIVRAGDYTGEICYCRGAFDNQDVRREIPLAVVNLASVALNSCECVPVKVGVARMPTGFVCNVSNSLFWEYPQFTDIICKPKVCDLTGKTVQHDAEFGQVDAVVTRSARRREGVDQLQPPCPPPDDPTRDDDQQVAPLVSDDENGHDDLMTETITHEEVDGDRIGSGNSIRTPPTNDERPEIGEELDTEGQSSSCPQLRSTGQNSEINAAATDSLDSDGNQTCDMTNAVGGHRVHSRTDTTSTLTSELSGDAETNGQLTEYFRQLSNIDTSDIETVDMPDSTETETANEFRREQRLDPKLTVLWHRANSGSAEYKVINGLLYKTATPSGAIADNEYLLVIPETHENEVIRLAHDTVFGGHLGISKTKQRIGSHFHFPKMKKKIVHYIKTCHACQMVAPKRKAERLPLQPIPVIGKYPFEDVSLDILGGDLPRTARGNKYLLTLVCNATKWIEAIPLRNLKAETIADRLLEIFSRVGIPQTIRSDNFQSFRSQIMSALRDKLGINPEFSAVYHSQSHGAVERANRTVEDVLKKFLADYPKTWDCLIMYLLFCLRETPHESTKFSPAELVYGRKIRGLLAVAKETWTKSDPMERKLNMSTVKYVDELNRRIKIALEAAGKNVTEAQAKMKENYDKTSTTRELRAGQLALILLPTEDNKLFSQWRGPYRVMRRCERNNYEIDVNGRRVIFHMNSLRRYYDREEEQQGDSDVEQVDMIIEENRDVITTGETSGEDQQHALAGEFSVGAQLTADQRRELQQLLERYSSVFSDEPGTTHLAEHVITVTDEIPVYQASYRIPEAMRDAVEDELKTMLSRGIIKYDYETKYNSPLVIVKKPNGGIRLVNNFINLNRKTVNVQYTMTNPNELLNRAAGFRYVSKLDIGCAYFQVPLSRESQHYTGFQTFMGPMSYCRMAMGLKCSAATFQRLMDNVLKGMHKHAGTLIDDTIVYSTTFQDHLKHLEQVLDRLRQAGLTAKREKCLFASNSIRIFGHLLQDGKIYPDQDKVVAIKECKAPKTKRQLKSFLGLTGYFRDYIDKYATIAFPLTELLKGTKPEKFTWTDRHQTAFDTLRTALTAKPVLYPPDINKLFKLMTDSSRVAISAVLLQGHDDGKTEHAIAYASRKLSDCERRYATVEQELLAIIFGLQKFRHMIYGCVVNVYTDHRPLVWLNSVVKNSSRLARWALLLQDYNITMTYVRGEEQIADCLTRLH